MSAPPLEYRLGNDWVPDLPPLIDADGSLLTGVAVTLTITTSPELGAEPVHGTLRRAASEVPPGSARYQRRFLGRDMVQHLTPGAYWLVVTSGDRYRAVHRVRVRG